MKVQNSNESIAMAMRPVRQDTKRRAPVESRAPVK